MADKEAFEALRHQQFEAGKMELMQHLSYPEKPLNTLQEYRIQLGKHEAIHGRNFDLLNFDFYQALNLKIHGHDDIPVARAIQEGSPNVEFSIRPEYGEQVLGKVYELGKDNPKIYQGIQNAPKTPSSLARVGKGIFNEMMEEAQALQQKAYSRGGISPPPLHQWDLPGGGSGGSAKHTPFKGVEDQEPWE